MRRGDIDLVEWLPRIILLIVAIIFTIALATYFTERDIPAARAQLASYAFRLHYDSELFTYVDPDIDRAIPGWIDLERFTSQTIERAYAKEGPYSQLASRMILRSTECGVEQLPGQILASDAMIIYHDEETYKRFAPFVGQGGPGGAEGAEFSYPVTVVNEGTKCPGMLQVNVVRPNS